MGNRIISLTTILFITIGTSAQQYTGMGGLIHVPSADMDTIPVSHIGAHYVNRNMIPEYMKIDGERYNSWTNYLSLQPFRWIEIGYGYTLWKFHRNGNPNAEIGFYSKDRYVSARIQPVREKQWWPSVIIGGNDVVGSNDNGTSASSLTKNYYVALSKHMDLNGHLIGAHIAYRHYKQDFNEKWNGVVGGLTVQPPFYRPLRFIGEYNGDGVNVGADCTLFRYVMLQASLQQCQYFSGGVCLRVPLTRMNKL